MRCPGARLGALIALVSCAFAVSLASSRALACGVSGPDGAVGCSIEEHDEEIRPRWSVGAAGGYTWTKLVFTHAPRASATRSAALASASYAPTPRLRIQVSAGVAISGQLGMPNGQHDFSPGPLGAVGVSYRFLKGRPFLLLSGLISGTSARTRLHGGGGDAARYTAIDLRMGLAAGYTFFDALSPYAVARVFGGPVFWRYEGEHVLGTDLYHVQLGAGLAWRIAGKVDLFAEGIALGERAVSGGVAGVF